MSKIDQFIEKQLAKAHKPRRRIVRPPIAPQHVYCEACGALQRDKGKRATCNQCGFAPLPSYEYEKDCCFHPDYKGATT